MKEWGVGSGGGCGWRGGGGEEGVGVGVTGYVVAELKNHAQSHMQSFSQARPQTELNLPPPPHLSKGRLCSQHLLRMASPQPFLPPPCPLPHTVCTTPHCPSQTSPSPRLLHTNHTHEWTHADAKTSKNYTCPETSHLCSWEEKQPKPLATSVQRWGECGSWDRGPV